MAGPRMCRNAGRAPTNDNSTLELTPTVFFASILMPTQTSIPTKALMPTQALASTPALASALGLLRRYTNKNLQRATKLALKSFLKGPEHG